MGDSLLLVAPCRCHRPERKIRCVECSVTGRLEVGDSIKTKARDLPPSRIALVYSCRYEVEFPIPTCSYNLITPESIASSEQNCRKKFNPRQTSSLLVIREMEAASRSIPSGIGLRISIVQGANAIITLDGDFSVYNYYFCILYSYPCLISFLSFCFPTFPFKCSFLFSKLMPLSPPRRLRFVFKQRTAVLI